MEEKDALKCSKDTQVKIGCPAAYKYTTAKLDGEGACQKAEAAQKLS